MIVVSAPLRKDTVDTFPEGNRKRRTMSRHQAARRLLPCSGPDLVLEDSNPVSGKDYEVHNTWASLCLEVAVYSNSHFPTACALGRGLSYDVLLFALHSQKRRRDLTMTQGMHSTYLNAAASVVIAVRSQKAVFEHQYFVAEKFASAVLLVPP